MDEHLVGYLLNTLDPKTKRAVEAYLRSHPKAAARVQRLRQNLAAWNDDAEMLAPPPNLVHKTLARIAEVRCRPELPPAPPPRKTALGGPRRFRPVDVAAAAVLLFLVGALALAWVPKSRQQAHDLACQNNLRVFWGALQPYSDTATNQHDFPRVEAEGPRSVAGIFVPILQDAGFLSPDASLTCSANANQPSSHTTVWELEQLYRNQPETFKSVAQQLAGSYAYSLGYIDNGSLTGLRRDSGDLLPIVADAPPASGLGLSLNHGGRGQNVLYIGGNVRWCTQRTVGINCDDIYLNQDGKLGTGRNWDDTVLGASGATPFGQGD